MIKNLHIVFDKLQEPYRFLAFFIPIALLFVGTEVGNTYTQLACWLALLAVLVSRMNHINRVDK